MSHRVQHEPDARCSGGGVPIAEGAVHWSGAVYHESAQGGISDVLEATADACFCRDCVSHRGFSRILVPQCAPFEHGGGHACAP